MSEKRLLGTVFALGLLGRTASVGALSERTGWERTSVQAMVRRLRAEGMLKTVGGGILLTPKGRRSIRVVLIGGGFEVIHAGHIHTIDQARKLGDVLVVVAATDATIRKRKGREPVSLEEERVRLLSSLRQVDATIMGTEGDIYSTLEKVRPDTIALGYDQYHQVEDVSKQAAKRGLKVRVVRLGTPVPGLKTSRLLRDF